MRVENPFSTPTELAETYRLWAQEMRDIALILDNIGDDDDKAESEQAFVKSARNATLLLVALDELLEARERVLDTWGVY